MGSMFIPILPRSGRVLPSVQISTTFFSDGFCENGALNQCKVESYRFVFLDWRGQGTIYLANLASRLVLYDNDSSHRLVLLVGGFGWNNVKRPQYLIVCGLSAAFDPFQDYRLDALDRNFANDSFLDQVGLKHLACLYQSFDYLVGVDQELYSVIPDRKGMELAMRVEHYVNVTQYVLCLLGLIIQWYHLLSFDLQGETPCLHLLNE
jgi:hypothetical protein